MTERQVAAFLNTIQEQGWISGYNIVTDGAGNVTTALCAPPQHWPNMSLSDRITNIIFLQRVVHLLLAEPMGNA